MKSRTLLLVTILITLVLSACELSLSGPTATPTINAAATQQAREAAQTQAAENEQATAEAEQILLGTETKVAERTNTAAVRATERESKSLTEAAQKTAEVVEATAAAEPMLQFVQELFGEGFLTRTEGSYSTMDDWTRAEAMINYFNRDPTFQLITDLVFRAHWAWESATDTADWWSSGCGITFRETLGENLYLVYLGLDGYANMFRMDNGNLIQLARQYAEKMDVPDGSADVALVAEGSQFYFFVNGERVITKQDTKHTNGFLGFSIVSGTNKDFGTRCTMSEIEIWTLD